MRTKSDVNTPPRVARRGDFGKRRFEKAVKGEDSAREAREQNAVRPPALSEPTHAEAGAYSPAPPRHKGSGTGGGRTMRDNAGKDRRTGLKQAGLTNEPEGEGGSTGGQRVTGPGHVEMDSNLKEE